MCNREETRSGLTRWMTLLCDALFLLPVLQVPLLFSGDFNTNTLVIKEPTLHLGMLFLLLGLVVYQFFSKPDSLLSPIPVYLTGLIVLFWLYLFYSNEGIAAHPIGDYEFLRWTVYFIIFVCYAYLGANQRRLRLLVYTTIAVSLVVSMYGILQTQEWFLRYDRQYLVDWETFSWEVSSARRVCSSLCNPDYLASYLVTVFPVTIMAAVVYRGWIRYGCLSIGFFQLIALLFTYSRGGWITLFIVSLLLASMFVYVNWMKDPVLVPTYISPKLLLVGISVFMGIGMGVMVWQWEEVYAALYRIANFGTGVSVSSRPYFYEGALRMMWDAPVFGHGIGMFGVVFPEYRAAELTLILPFQEWAVGHVHNEYLEIGSETGLIGLLFYTVLLLSCAGVIWKSLVDNRTRENLLLLGLGCGIFAALFHNMFTVTLRYAPSAFLLWSFAGAALGCAYSSANPHLRFKSIGLKCLVVIGTAALIPYVYSTTTKYYVGDHLLRHSMDTVNYQLTPEMGVEEVRRQLEDSLLRFNRCVELAPHLPRGLFQQGLIYNKLVKDYPQAREVYLQVEELWPAFTSTRRNLCVNYLLQGDALRDRSQYYEPLVMQCVEQARQWAEKAIDSDPLEPEYHFLLGQCLMEQWKMDAAKEAFKRSMELIPQMLPQYRRVSKEECLEQIQLLNELQQQMDTLPAEARP